MPHLETPTAQPSEQAPTSASASVPHVAVIGAGAAGITAMKELLQAGVSVVGFDKADRIGGLWVFQSSSGLSPAYSSLHLNTSKGRTEFADYPMPADWEDYPAASKVADYLADYADHFGVTEHVRFATTVQHVEKVLDPQTGTEIWQIEAVTDSGEQIVEHADAVIVANGHNWDPKLAHARVPRHVHRRPDARPRLPQLRGVRRQARARRRHRELRHGHRRGCLLRGQ